jgi:hypothetical protein
LRSESVEIEPLFSSEKVLPLIPAMDEQSAFPPYQGEPYVPEVGPVPAPAPAASGSRDWKAKYIIASVVCYLLFSLISSIVIDGVDMLLLGLLELALFSTFLWLLYRFFIQKNRDCFTCTTYLVVLLIFACLYNFLAIASDPDLVKTKLVYVIFICLVSINALIAMCLYFAIQHHYGQRPAPTPLAPSNTRPTYTAPTYGQPPYAAQAYPPQPGYGVPAYGQPPYGGPYAAPGYGGEYAPPGYGGQYPAYGYPAVGAEAEYPQAAGYGYAAPPVGYAETTLKGGVDQ